MNLKALIQAEIEGKAAIAKAKREVSPFTKFTDQLGGDTGHSSETEQLQGDLGSFFGNEGPERVSLRRPQQTDHKNRHESNDEE